MPYKQNDALLLPWVACVLKLAGVSFGANERLGKRQREEC